jgi:hypothetical protein
VIYATFTKASTLTSIVFKSIYALSLLKVVKKPVGSAEVSLLKLALEAKLGFRGKAESNSESA